LIARFARCDVRYVAAVLVGAGETEKASFLQLLLQTGGANIAGSAALAARWLVQRGFNPRSAGETYLAPGKVCQGVEPAG
jgi:hypothetical protein